MPYFSVATLLAPAARPMQRFRNALGIKDGFNTAVLVIAVMSCFGGGAYSEFCEIGLMTGMEGTFYSPGFPSPYPKNLDCSHLIEMDPDNYIVITFYYFNLEGEKNTDYLEILDGEDDNPVQKSVFYGLKGSEKFYFFSKTNRVRLNFHSNDEIEHALGYMADYKAFTTLCKPMDMVVANGKFRCTLDGSGEYATSCSVECDPYWVLLDEATVPCNNGTFGTPPLCRADELKLTVCLKNINNARCPFTQEETGAETAAYLEEVGDVQISLGRTRQGCNKALCRRKGNTNELVYKCIKRSKFLLAAGRLKTEENRLAWKKHVCEFCQSASINCWSNHRFL